MTGDGNDRTDMFVPLVKGTKVSHYRIIEKIGAGGMGEVYLAQDTELERRVALKFLPPHLCQDDDCRARFKREAQAAAQLSHPNIVTIHEVGEHLGRPYFAMQHVEGMSLRDELKAKKPDIDRVLEIAIQLCDGLGAAHEKKVIHRDIKPSNIVIDAYGRPKLLDFGLAAIVGGEQLTRTGSTLGTVGYMSPEQIHGKDVDHRSDLFSFGAVMYEMITGHRPFQRETDAASINAVLNDTAEPLSRYTSKATPELERIVVKLLEKDPTLRYQSAAGIVSDLKKLTGTAKPAIPAKPTDWWNRYVVSAAFIVLAVVAGYWLISTYVLKPPATESERKSLAVLPFENLGSAEDEYFADGITDEITARLAGISGLRVTSRTSAVFYKNTSKKLKEIADELGVDLVLEGTIRWDKSGDTDRVRITPQLIRVSDDSHVWADTYERALTQVFQVQAEIASSIAEALDITLMDSEKKLLASPPTDNLEAYDYYLRGKEYWDIDFNTDLAIEMFEKAVELDSSFYLAHGALARAYGYMYLNLMGRPGEQYERIREAADNAMKYSNGGSAGHLAMGYFHYYGSRNYDQALSEFEMALKDQPNNSDILAAIGYVQRRQGRWNESVASLRKAVQLDPRSLNKTFGMVMTLSYLHQYGVAETAIDRVLSLAPDDARFHMWKTFAIFERTGDSTQVRQAINNVVKYGDRDFTNFLLEQFDVLCFRDYESALMRRPSFVFGEMEDSADFYYGRAEVLGYLNDTARSRAYYDSARLVSEGRLETDPGQGMYRMDLALAYAGLGHADEAVVEGRRAVELLPLSEDALLGPDLLIDLASLYVMVGEHDLAIDLIDQLLTIPSLLSPRLARVDPQWDPLRDNPRFKAVLEKHPLTQ